jgi:hypothetical protein
VGWKKRKKEISGAIRPLEIKIEVMDNRLAGEFASLRNELQRIVPNS